MFSKIKIDFEIEVLTGLHIGGGGEISMIGAIDSPVVRDSHTHLPIIPGSSIKGKLRTLLAKTKNDLPVSHHNGDHDEIKRLFGSSEPKNIQRARLQISDAFFNEESFNEFNKLDIPYTETKFENTIDRKTLIANPRQIERVTRGAKFDLTVIYNVENEEQVNEDFENIKTAITLLEHDYLGGGGTRGNGRIKFNVKDIKTVVGHYDSSHLVVK
ncbi:type III-A CRISPR-associated RAMP protein Csm3 [Macrococcus capreoli]